MKPTDATARQEVPDTKQIYPMVRLKKNTLHVPEGVKRANRFDECLGPYCWSCLIIRENGMGECEIHTRYNIILTGFQGLFLFTDADGKTVLAREENHIVGLLPGTYRLRTYNTTGPLSLAYCMVLDDATAHLWAECGYFNKSSLRQMDDPPLKMHFARLQFLGDPYDQPPGVLGFRIVRLLGKFGMYFNSFFRDGPFKEYTFKSPDSLHTVLEDIPHLDWVERKRRKKYPALRKRLLQEWRAIPCTAKSGINDDFEFPPGFERQQLP